MTPLATPPAGADIEADKKALHRFGYAQQLLRDMGGFSNFAISFSIISILTGAVTLYGTGLQRGGPVVAKISKHQRRARPGQKRRFRVDGDGLRYRLRLAEVR